MTGSTVCGTCHIVVTCDKDCHITLQLPKSEEDIVDALPNKEQMVDTMVITKLLSSRGTKSLAEWEFQYQYEPTALKIEKEYVNLP